VIRQLDCEADLPPVAIIADAHCHDIHSDYDTTGITLDGQTLTLRSWADTRRASRVFNESRAALKLALHDIQKRGIKHVVLLGDYSDDGQIEATERIIQLLRHHRDRYGTKFFAITGNHDAYGPSGKHQSTRFVSSPKQTTLVTSDPKVAATEPGSAILTSKMYCEGVPQGIARMAEFGLFNQSNYLHWETPFGRNDSLESRQYIARSEDGLQAHRLVDASYLVEPVEGLWLLMIDANVFEPRNGQWKPSQKQAFLDSSEAGWNSLLRNRPHVIDWISEICSRADQTGKTLLAFSHYPTIDPFADVGNDAEKLFANSEMLRRQPDLAVSEALMNSGLRLHFSGHLHVSALSQRTNDANTLEDCAVPSLAAFPADYKIVHPDSLSIDTVQLDSMSLDPMVMSYYRDEAITAGDPEDAALQASCYGEFLYRRMHTRVIHHYLPKEWPEDIAGLLSDASTADLALLMLMAPDAVHSSTMTGMSGMASAQIINRLEQKTTQHSVTLDELSACRMTQLISDWYCLRHAGFQARAYIGSDNIKIYRFLTDCFADPATRIESNPQAFFAIFLRMLKSSLQRSELSVTRECLLSV